MKPSPHCSIARAIASGAHSILTPSAASTSAEPEREEIERLPCLATGTPAPATTNAAQVEILCVPLASPPVPHVSIAPSGARTATARALSARAAPAISSTVPPRTRNPIRSAPICASVAPPDMMSPNASAASLSLSVAPSATRRRMGRRSASSAMRAAERLEDTGRRSWRFAACAPLDAGKVEEIGEEPMAVFRGDALGMELHAMHGVALVLQPHDDAVARLGCDLQRVGQACALDHERMVARGGEVLGDAGEHAFASVMHLRQFAVHQRRRAHDAAAIDLADGLMAEADAEDRHGRAGALDKLEANPGAVGIARSGRKYDRLGGFRQDLVHADLVVAIDARRGAQFAKEMDEGVGEAVVVIDQREHPVVLRLRPVSRQGAGVRAPAQARASAAHILRRQEQAQIPAIDRDVLP